MLLRPNLWQHVLANKSVASTSISSQISSLETVAKIIIHTQYSTQAERLLNSSHNDNQYYFFLSHVGFKFQRAIFEESQAKFRVTSFISVTCMINQNVVSNLGFFFRRATSIWRHLKLQFG